MMRTKILLAVCVVVTATERVQSAPIFSQPPLDMGEAFVSSDNSGSANYVEIADSWFSSGETVTKVRWWGAYTATTTPSTDNFLIRFYNRSGSFPGTAVYTADVGDSITRTSTTMTATIGSTTTVRTLYEYEVELPSGGFVNSSSTVYWLSVQNFLDDAGEAGNWLWGRSGSQNSSFATRFEEDGSWFTAVSTQGNRAWELEDATLDTPPVPEPTSLALLATGAFGFMGYGWRRKRKQAA